MLSAHERIRIRPTSGQQLERFYRDRRRRFMWPSLAIRRLGIDLIVVSFIYSPEVSGAEITKRVVFPKGKTSVSYKGSLTREYASYDSYLLRARKGQTITVKLTTTDRDASFAIYETKK